MQEEETLQAPQRPLFLSPTDHQPKSQQGVPQSLLLDDSSSSTILPYGFHPSASDEDAHECRLELHLTPTLSMPKASR
jgi:hypothetical protein